MWVRRSRFPDLDAQTGKTLNGHIRMLRKT
jgi:hypothetical protein